VRPGSNLKSYVLQYDGANNITRRNDDVFQYDALNQLLYANLKGNFEIDPREEQQQVGLVREDITGGKPLEFAVSQSELTELDYNSGSIGVDLYAPVKITKIALTPQSPIHQVTAENTGVFYSNDNATYSEATGWQLTAKEKGGLEITFKTPVTARYIKVLSYYHIRDNEFNPVDTATFKNTPQELIKVYYLLTTRQEDYTYYANGDRMNETITERSAKTRKESLGQVFGLSIRNLIYAIISIDILESRGRVDGNNFGIRTYVNRRKNPDDGNHLG
jgi:hypothetical protein